MMQRPGLGVGLALQLAEDDVLVLEEIADQLVAVLLVQRDGVAGLGPQYTGRERGGEADDVRLVGGGEVDETGEVRGEGVEGGDVV